MTNACGNFFSKRRPLKIVGMVIGGILLAGLMAFLFGWVIMLLWNWLMPEIFGLGTITYWQGFGIFFLAKIIFGFGGDHSSNNSKKDDKKKTIKGEIGSEIKKEIRKEIRKEFAKENGHDFNEEYDDKYEDWWSTEGKEAFDSYMNKDKKEEEEEKTEL